VKVHHLNCGTMRPPVIDAMVCHVLLVESGSGLVLVDAGFGSLDCENPARFGHIRRHLIRPVFDPAETALRQVERLGFERSDVRHIIVTHFDADHIGGIADFPDAQIHVTTAEAVGAMRPRQRAPGGGVAAAAQSEISSERVASDGCNDVRADRLRMRLRDEADRGVIDGRTARDLDEELAYTEDMQRSYCASGMSNWREERLDRQFAQIEDRLRYVEGRSDRW